MKTSLSEFPINILDRTRPQLISDQKADVTPQKAHKQAFEKVSEHEDGYLFDKGILMHRNTLKDLPHGMKYVDCIVVPEAYRNEILRVSHTIFL